MFNPLGMISPEQQKRLEEIQKYTKDISAEITQDGNVLTVTLNTTNPEAVKGIPQIQTAIIDSVASCLQVLFQIAGVIKGKNNGSP